MDLTHTATSIVTGLILLFLGADALVRGSSRLALRGGISPLVVGMTVVAFGTGSPELVVSLHAAIIGREAVAVGNVVGSNIVNLALILGLAAIIRPMLIQSQLCKLDLPILASCSAILTLLLLDRGLGRIEGIFLLAGFITYTAINVKKARLERVEVQTEYESALPRKIGRLWLDIFLILLGLLLLIGGGDLLLGGSLKVATHFGISDALIGLTVVALGTSLPELATSTLAAWRGEGDIALGTLIGSSVFNILAVLGPAAVISPMHASGVTILDLGTMTLVAFLILPLMRTGFRLSRGEGFVLVAVYVGYMYLLLG